ncbi:leucine-rich repeat protein [Artemisia annua]|uniref:Leucine-rich repeat protein n=1 Tax=Artemisia annua TaxID=35608 RepID=A0A2U1LB34_ARTAN|nr:leucine-rich repeat protein [Artemisia annua]
MPAFIGSLGNLRYLNLSSSNFDEIIPPQLGNLSDLHTLCLGSFQDGWDESTSVVNMEWLSNLRLLLHLDMSYVDLSKATDWFQVINTLPSLTELHLKSSHLMDVHPHAPSLNITFLLLLDLSGNQFTNSLVPRWIFSITSLVSLDLSECDFNGLIPSSSAHSFRNLTSFKWLHVYRNTFMNSSLVLKGLSSGFGSNLILLDIRGCHISSTALDSLHNLNSLLSLDLSSNLLTNILPKSLGKFCNLRDIDLSSNDFDNISLTCLLESFFECKSPRLESLSISSSGLSGILHLKLGYNNISGSFPDSIRLFSFLRTLDLSENQISGPIPFLIGRLSVLEVLDLSENQISGPIPFSIGRLSVLEVLDLSVNQVNGNLPYSIGRLSLLKKLDLSGNQFNGSLGQLSKCRNRNPLYQTSVLQISVSMGKQLNPTTADCKLDSPFPVAGIVFELVEFRASISSMAYIAEGANRISISNTNISSPIPESFWRSSPRVFRYVKKSDARYVKSVGHPSLFLD